MQRKLRGTKEQKAKCAICGRSLRNKLSTHSSWTGNHFCWPGEGCQKIGAKRRKRKEAKSGIGA